MRYSRLLAAGTVLAGLAAVEAPASAATLCPTGPTIGGTGACDFVITFNADGSTSTAATSVSGSSIGGEDAIIGVINNSPAAISSFVLTGTNDIYGFDGDGIDTYTGQTPNAQDNSGYGGPITYFTNINANDTSGTVNFIGGVAPGATTYFSLEDAISPSAPPVITGPVTGPGGPTGVPEPATMTLLGASLLGLGLARHRRRRG